MDSASNVGGYETIINVLRERANVIMPIRIENTIRQMQELADEDIQKRARERERIRIAYEKKEM